MSEPLTLPRSDVALGGGRVVGDRFELGVLAGVGGMGAVYRATDRETGGVVAVKVTTARDERSRARFALEASVLRELHHPGIVRYVAHGVAEDGASFLAMEWLEGEDLAARLSRGALGLSESVALAAAVARALGAAHARGVVHRDIKPSNLFLPGGALDRVKVLDFGIARDADRARLTTRRGMLGTLGYMSPEQARGDPDIDARADIFSLGCVLFECATGRAAFGGEHVVAVLAKILLEEPPRLRDRGLLGAGQLDALITRMLSKDRADRPLDGDAMADELEALDGEASSSPRVSVLPASLTRGEQRLLCVIVAGRLPDALASTVLADATLAPTNEPQKLEIEAVLKPFQAHIERLVDGSLIVTLEGGGAATDQASRAARCALALRSVLRDAPIALATGRGEMGGALPIGEVIDRVATLVRATREDDSHEASGIRLDDVTAGLLDARFEVRGAGLGLELVAERELRDSARKLLGRATPFVGRERELAMLVGAYDECVAESAPRVVLVTAAAGVGKSRLAAELCATLAARAEPPEIWQSRGDPMSAGAPFVMIAPLLRHAAGFREGEPLEARRRKLAARVARHVAAAERERVTEFLGELAAPFPADASPNLRAARADPIVMGDRVRRAFVDFLAADCAQRPVVLVLEDLHWGDLPSVSLLDTALRANATTPWMILALARPEVTTTFPGLWSGRELERVALRDLSARASAKLTRDVLGEVPEETVARVVQQAAGNAFYLEELIRAIASGNRSELPGTVLAMMQARLEALPPETRRVLRAASVFGQTFWSGAVGKLVGLLPRSGELLDCLTELVAEELVSERSEPAFPGEIEYAFRHALVRDVAYGMLTHDDRVLGHLLAGDWLGAHREIDARLVAEHLERGGDRDRARDWYRRAGEEALASNDFDAAIACAARGIACGATGETRGALHILRSEAHAWKSEHAIALEEARAATELFVRAGEAWFRAVSRIVLECRRLGRVEDASAWASALFDAWRPDDLSGAAIIAACTAADTLCLLGRPLLGCELIERIERRLPEEESLDPSVLGHVHRARAVRRQFGERDPSAMAVGLARSIAAFDAAGDIRNACVQRANRGFSLLPLGDNDECERELRAAMEVAERLGLLTLVSVCEHNLGAALGRRGLYDEAVAMESRAIAAFSMRGDLRLEAAARLYLARLEVDRGSFLVARAEAERAVELARTIKGTRAQALGVLSRAHLALGDAESALKSAREACAILTELGGLEGSEEAVRLALAEALAATGDHAAAKAALSEARRNVLERAACIADPAWRRMFLERAPASARILELCEAWGLHAPSI